MCNAGMEIRDARKLSPSVQEEKRRLAIRLWKRGNQIKSIACAVGVSAQAVSGWIKRYNAEGPAALKARKRGPKVGSSRRLTREQEQRLKKMISVNAPDQLKLAHALWTRKAVMKLMERETGIAMPIRTVGEYLKRWGFIPEKPIKRANKLNHKVVKIWLDEEYPSIKETAKKENAEIYWCNETRVLSNSEHKQSYAIEGKTSVTRLSEKWRSTNMISAITNQGKVCFKVFNGGMNADILIEFCERLIKSSKRKVYLILDNLRIRDAKAFIGWREQHSKAIKVFYLPWYSAESNPDEYINNDINAGARGGKTSINKKGA